MTDNLIKNLRLRWDGIIHREIFLLQVHGQNGRIWRPDGF